MTVSTNAVTALAVSLLAIILVACQSIAPSADPLPSPVADRDLRAATCAEWLAMTDEQRLVLAGLLVGDPAALLERIRAVQQMPVGTGREALIRAVAGSLTKNCEVRPPRSRTVDDLVDGLYGGP